MPSLELFLTTLSISSSGHLLPFCLLWALSSPESAPTPNLILFVKMTSFWQSPCDAVWNSLRLWLFLTLSFTLVTSWLFLSVSSLDFVVHCYNHSLLNTPTSLALLSLCCNQLTDPQPYHFLSSLQGSVALVIASLWIIFLQYKQALEFLIFKNPFLVPQSP